MSVKFIDNHCFYGFRVRRTVAGKLYQEYMPLTVNGVRLGLRTTKGRVAKAAADRRDAELIKLKDQFKKETKPQRCFKKDGSVKGISLLYKKELSKNITPIFQVGIQSEIESKIICTAYSMTAHGEQGAWLKAVNTFAKHKKIHKNSQLYKDILGKMPAVDKSKTKNNKDGRKK